MRHGLTSWNRERRFQGQLDVPLNEEGLGQASLLAKWLVDQPVHFAALYSSDLSRARQTAEIIGQALGLDPVLIPKLREIHGGNWQGLLTTEIDELYPGQLAEWHETIDRFTLPGGESIPIVQERVVAFYRQALARHNGQSFIIVSHGMALAALQAAIHGWDLLDTFRTGRARLGNTGVSGISLDPQSGDPRIVFHNSSAHLESPTGMSSFADGVA